MGSICAKDPTVTPPKQNLLPAVSPRSSRKNSTFRSLRDDPAYESPVPVSLDAPTPAAQQHIDQGASGGKAADREEGRNPLGEEVQTRVQFTGHSLVHLSPDPSVEGSCCSSAASYYGHSVAGGGSSGGCIVHTTRETIITAPTSHRSTRFKDQYHTALSASDATVASRASRLRNALDGDAAAPTGDDAQ